MELNLNERNQTTDQNSLGSETNNTVNANDQNSNEISDKQAINYFETVLKYYLNLLKMIRCLDVLNLKKGDFFYCLFNLTFFENSSEYFKIGSDRLLAEEWKETFKKNDFYINLSSKKKIEIESVLDIFLFESCVDYRVFNEKLSIIYPHLEKLLTRMFGFLLSRFIPLI